MATILIGMGGNLGDREGNLKLAARKLSESFGDLTMSSIYETEPVGFADQPPYLNAVARACSDLDPHEVLAVLQRIELDLGRERSFRNAPRTIDLDLLFYDDLILDSPDLTVPHPRLYERAFVLVPLAELAPDQVHPRLQRTVRDLLREIEPVEGVHRYDAQLAP